LSERPQRAQHIRQFVTRLWRSSRWGIGSKKPIADFKRIEAANLAASGIAESYVEKEELLQEVVSAIAEKEHQERAERCDSLVAESRLLEAGEELRSQALQRKRSRERSPDEETSWAGSERDRNEIDGMSRADHDLILRAEQRQVRREELDSKRYILQESTAKLDEEKIELLKRRCVADEARIDVERGRLLQDQIRQVNDEKRLKLDMERFELEKDERKQTMSLIEALVAKLNK
jgi:hypothetical protein